MNVFDLFEYNDEDPENEGIEKLHFNLKRNRFKSLNKNKLHRGHDHGVDETAEMTKGMKSNHEAFKMQEARKSDYNFDIEDIKRLEQIRDLATLKTQAMALISKPSAKPMRPEKVEWFRSSLERMNSPMKVIKLMYDLMLSGEGHQVIGSRSSMNPNSYRSRFGEGVAEGSSGAKYKIKSIGKDKNGDYYISPKTGKKVYKKAKVGDHETPGGEVKPKVAEGNEPRFLDDDFYAYDPDTMEIKDTWSHKSVGRRHSEHRAQQQGLQVVSGMRARSLGLHYPTNNEAKQRLDPKCWTGYKKQGTKMKGGVRVNNCVPVEEAEIPSMYSKQVPPGMEHRARYKCPNCGIANKVQDWAANDNECPTCLEPLPYGLNQMPLKYQVAEENKGLYYNVNKRKKAGTSRPAGHPKAPTAQAWKDAAKTAKKNESMVSYQMMEALEEYLYELELAGYEIINEKRTRP